MDRPRLHPDEARLRLDEARDELARANRLVAACEADLLDAIAEALDAGLSKVEVAKRVGVSRTWLYQLLDREAVMENP